LTGREIAVVPDLRSPPQLRLDDVHGRFPFPRGDRGRGGVRSTAI